jgi:hypothetical protein
MPTLAPPAIDLDAMRAAITATIAVEPPATRTARRVTMHEAKGHFDAGGDVLVSEYGHKSTIAVGPNTVVHNWRTTTWQKLREQVAEWRGRYPNQRYYIIDTTREQAFGGHRPAPSNHQPTPPAAEPAPEPDPADEHPALTANPTLTYALDAAFNELWPGDSKTATAHRAKVWKAVASQLAEVEAYGLDLGGRVPIGDPIVLGNAVIEVDGYGDAVSITTTDGGMPLWDKP